MMQIKARLAVCEDYEPMWKPILSAPSGRDLELAVFDEDGEHALVFACVKDLKGWRNAVTGARVDISPTHWRDWSRASIQANERKTS
ncbi:hypothetical protein [Mesorhizobium helmanticense]